MQKGVSTVLLHRPFSKRSKRSKRITGSLASGLTEIVCVSLPTYLAGCAGAAPCFFSVLCPCLLVGGLCFQERSESILERLSLQDLARCREVMDG